jgi:hypothetical protein
MRFVVKKEQAARILALAVPNDPIPSPGVLRGFF